MIKSMPLPSSEARAAAQTQINLIWGIHHFGGDRHTLDGKMGQAVAGFGVLLAQARRGRQPGSNKAA